MEFFSPEVKRDCFAEIGLVIDEALLQTLSGLLRKKFLVVAVSSMEAAVEKCSEQVFDVAFLDLNVGTRSGEEFLPFLELFSLSVPKKVIVMTGHSQNIAMAGIRRQVHSVLEKPFSFASLMHEVEHPLT